LRKRKTFVPAEFAATEACREAHPSSVALGWREIVAFIDSIEASRRESVRQLEFPGGSIVVCRRDST
jgi:hypothetical protein